MKVYILFTRYLDGSEKFRAFATPEALKEAKSKDQAYSRRISTTIPVEVEGIPAPKEGESK